MLALTKRGGLLLGAPADLADHDDRFGLGIVLEHLQHVEKAWCR
jgi:hypothetical protein